MFLLAWEVWEAWALWRVELPDQQERDCSISVKNILVTAESLVVCFRETNFETMTIWKGMAVTRKKDPLICIFQKNIFFLTSISIVDASGFL